jgi:hypothetical protein
LVLARAFAQIRRYPILALPVLIADLLGFVALHLQHALHQPLFDWFLVSRGSVLGVARSHFVLTPANAAKAGLIAAPLIVGCYFLIVCLYVAALHTTFVMVEAIASDQAPRLQSGTRILFRSKRRFLPASYGTPEGVPFRPGHAECLEWRSRSPSGMTTKKATAMAAAPQICGRLKRASGGCGGEDPDGLG